jgi:hypothetical protein
MILKEVMIHKGFNAKNFLPNKNNRNIEGILNNLTPLVEEALKKYSYRYTVTSKQIYKYIASKNRKNFNLSHIGMVIKYLGGEKISNSRYINPYYSKEAQIRKFEEEK